MALALASLGAKFVTGIDVMPRNITAAAANRERLQLGACVQFMCEDVHEWSPAEKYDVVVSHEALEHIDEPERFLNKLDALTTPSGSVCTGVWSTVLLSVRRPYGLLLSDCDPVAGSPVF
jgi:2-polyprenyl-3-methyl-5-hydroxy-6-metoxy-1,4-benzoquinol methylase